MRKCIVHIGLDKTGTTSLQHWLYVNRANLLKYGFLYPTSGIVSNHHLTIAQSLGFSPESSLTPPRNTTTLRGEGILNDFCIEIEATNHELTIISSEHFCYTAGVKPIIALRELLDGFDVQIIVYLREQVSWAASLYAESIKWGNTQSFDGFISVRGARLNYLNHLSMWSSVFGESHIIVRVYDKNLDIISDFAEVIEFPKEAWEAMSRDMPNLNVSLPDSLIEMQRLANAVLAPAGIARACYSRALSVLGRSPITNNKGRVWPLPTRLLGQIDALEENNSELARVFLKREKLFSQDLRSYAHDYNLALKEFNSEATLAALCFLAIGNAGKSG